MNLFRVKLDLIRKTASTGYYDDSTDQWVDGTQDKLIPIKCSVQPFKDGYHRFEIPEGVRTDASYIVYTKSQLIPQDNINNTPPDLMVYKGNTFECIAVEDWDDSGLRVSHNKGLFVRKDLQ